MLLFPAIRKYASASGSYALSRGTPYLDIVAFVRC
jgi:hypothetical protein